MTIDVSIPDPIFEAAEELSQELGISRSELYTAALTAYLTIHKANPITEILDRLYETESSTLSPDLIHMQIVSIDREAW